MIMSDYQIIPFNDTPRVPFKLDGRKLFTSEMLEIIHLTLQPGESMDAHTQPMDVVFFVLEGTGTLSIGVESIVVGENTTIHVRSGVQRAWNNTGNQPLRILVNKLLIG
jgi:quercetin dioxygenase-like cupin family protein